MDEIKSLTSGENYEKISDMSKNKSTGDELEIIFSTDGQHFTLTHYLEVVEYFKGMVKKGYVIKQSKTLDVLLKMDEKSYRISFAEDDDNKIMDFVKEIYGKQSYSVFRMLLEDILKRKSKNISFMSKEKKKENYVDLLDTPFPLRIRLSNERNIEDGEIKDILKFLDNNNVRVNGNIFYRYKDRISLTHEAKKVSIDLTLTKMSENPKTLDKNINYELEIEDLSKKDNLDNLFTELINILKKLCQTDILISRKEINLVLAKYFSLVNGKVQNHIKLRNSVSLDTLSAVTYLENSYAVTDKADGARANLIIIGETAYLIDVNTKVTKLPNKISSDLSGTILDGEFITTVEGQKIYLAFDILFDKSNDVRNQSNFKERIKTLEKNVAKMYKSEYTFPDYYDTHKSYDLAKMNCFYTKEYEKYLKIISNISSKNTPIIKKFYLFPYGGNASEIFLYASLLWKWTGKRPYLLDGLIFTPLDGNYHLTDKSREYKWKPAEKNSIDFYIEFEKDESGKPILFFDELSSDKRNYYICNLFVGRNRGGTEEPIRFEPDEFGPKKCYLFLTKGQAYDVENKILRDKTVVEFAYSIFEKDKPDWFRWIPMRTRHDKTYMVNKYGKKYGNEMHVATEIWKTIWENFSIDDITSLSNPETYDTIISQLKKKMSNKMNSSSRKIDTFSKQNRLYYQKVTELAKPMRGFHNWIKSNLINLYCSPTDSRAKNVLDYGCGRGGDIFKMMSARVGIYVGIDHDYAGLFTSENSAQQRANELKKSGNYHFIHADGRYLLTLEDQKNSVKNIENSASLFKQFFSGFKFDTINVQFSVHYFLGDSKWFDNFCENLNTSLKDGGHVIITCFDGDTIKKNLSGKNNYAVKYKNENGAEQLFLDIRKKYQDADDLPLVGNSIDFFNSIISDDDTYITEYLVMYDKFIAALKLKSGLKLIDSALFTDIYKMNKEFLERSEKSNSQLEMARKYHYLLNNKNPKKNEIVEKNIAEAGFEFTRLNRYYIFQKRVSRETKFERQIYREIDSVEKYIHAPFLEKNLMSKDFYILNKKFEDIKTLKKDVLGEKEGNVHIIDNRSEKMYFSIREDDHELLLNESIHVTKAPLKKDKNIFVYKFKNSYYPLFHKNTNKRKIIFSNDNKFIKYLN